MNAEQDAADKVKKEPLSPGENNAHQTASSTVRSEKGTADRALGLSYQSRSGTESREADLDAFPAGALFDAFAKKFPAEFKAELGEVLEEVNLSAEKKEDIRQKIDALNIDFADLSSVQSVLGKCVDLDAELQELPEIAEACKNQLKQVFIAYSDKIEQYSNQLHKFNKLFAIETFDTLRMLEIDSQLSVILHTRFSDHLKLFKDFSDEKCNTQKAELKAQEFEGKYHKLRGSMSSKLNERDATARKEKEAHKKEMKVLIDVVKQHGVATEAHLKREADIIAQLTKNAKNE